MEKKFSQSLLVGVFFSNTSLLSIATQNEATSIRNVSSKIYISRTNGCVDFGMIYQTEVQIVVETTSRLYVSECVKSHKEQLLLQYQKLYLNLSYWALYV